VTDLLVSTGSLLVVAVVMFFLGYDAGRWTVKRKMEHERSSSEAQVGKPREND
jgi:hypothetical protein